MDFHKSWQKSISHLNSLHVNPWSRQLYLYFQLKMFKMLFLRWWESLCGPRVVFIRVEPNLAEICTNLRHFRYYWSLTRLKLESENETRVRKLTQLTRVTRLDLQTLDTHWLRSKSRVDWLDRWMTRSYESHQPVKSKRPPSLPRTNSSSPPLFLANFDHGCRC